MTVLPAFPTAPAFDPAARTVAIPRQSRGAHRAQYPPERSRVPVAPVPVERLLQPVAPASHPRMSPAVRGAAAAAYTVVARAGSLTTLAAMLVLGGAVAGATDGPAASAPATGTVTTLQGP